MLGLRSCRGPLFRLKTSLHPLQIHLETKGKTRSDRGGVLERNNCTDGDDFADSTLILRLFYSAVVGSGALLCRILAKALPMLVVTKRSLKHQISAQ